MTNALTHRRRTKKRDVNGKDCHRNNTVVKKTEKIRQDCHK